MDKKQHKSVATTVIVTLMSLILTLNNFVFNDKNYLQIKGCAMGTICAPPFANIFMGRFEETFIYPNIQNLCILYLRYIDDLFLIWTGTKEQFKDFVMNLNSQHPSIKFSYQISDKSIDFLDTTVYIKNRRLHTTIFTKPRPNRTTFITSQNTLFLLRTTFHLDKFCESSGFALKL